MNAICLNCHKDLPLLSSEDNGKHVCSCGCEIPYTHGIYQFVHTDSFYEGKFTTVHKQKNAFKRLMSSLVCWISIDGNEERMWQRCKRFIREQKLGKPLQILNIGSGGGHDFLNELGTVTAVDLSLESLLNAQSLYDVCYLADAVQLPFDDESFDLVFSSHLLGHIPLNDKQKVVREIFRVTKKGGYSLHSAECEASNFIYKRAKQYPDLYQKYFVEMYGHFGLELPNKCKKRFRDENFEPIIENSDFCKGFIRPADSYKVFFGSKEYREKDWVFNVLAKSSEVLSCNKVLRILSGIVLYLLTPFNRVCGQDGVDSVKLFYQKRL